MDSFTLSSSGYRTAGREIAFRIQTEQTLDLTQYFYPVITSYVFFTMAQQPYWDRASSLSNIPDHTICLQAPINLRQQETYHRPPKCVEATNVWSCTYTRYTPANLTSCYKNRLRKSNMSSCYMTLQNVVNKRRLKRRDNFS